LYSFYFTLEKKSQTFSTQFIVPLFEILHPLYFIKVISDRWICTENILPLSFKSMILPSKFSPPHELLDLQPMPASNIDQLLAKELKITYLNQIQTQAYQSIVNKN
jgi:pre-mRNA-splicing helicase BRR2